MKKIIFSIVMAFVMIASTNANKVNLVDHIEINDIEAISDSTVKKDYNFYVNHRQLGKFLGLNDSTQLYDVYRTYDAFCSGMKMAENADNEKSRTMLMYNSIDYTLRNMRMYLDKWQYRQFLCGLNVSLYNKGFFKEMYEYCTMVRK